MTKRKGIRNLKNRPRPRRRKNKKGGNAFGSFFSNSKGTGMFNNYKTKNYTKKEFRRTHPGLAKMTSGLSSYFGSQKGGIGGFRSLFPVEGTGFKSHRRTYKSFRGLQKGGGILSKMISGMTFGLL